MVHAALPMHQEEAHCVPEVRREAVTAGPPVAVLQLLEASICSREVGQRVLADSCAEIRCCFGLEA